MKWNKSSENSMKFEGNINLKKTDEIWSEYKSSENLVKLEVNISLQNIRWNLKWI